MLNLSPNSAVVFEKRFLLRDVDQGIVETPEGLFRRVSKAVAGAESRFETAEMQDDLESAFYALMASFDFLPNSPTLMNAGTSMGQLSACFVLPVEDNLISIFDTLKNAAIIQQSGGGTGFNFSQLRPKGDFISKTSGEAAGPVSFMKIFNTATDQVKQGGRRRGANMGILNVDHPDILEFIRIKKDGISLTNFNLSVGVFDAFMHAVERKEKWALRHPSNGEIVNSMDANALWQDIVGAAWKCGDPGLVFLDQINRKNPTPALGRILATNPCGEVPLLAYEACNLGSINLSNMILANEKKINWQKLKDVIHLAIRFLDNVIEINNYPLTEIRRMVLGNRKIGLGVMGWAELLIKLEVPYDSQMAVKLGEKLMKFIERESFQMSLELAKERGVFPNWEKSIYYPSLKVRNATRTSIAPTGTISILANTSSSIEPLFALAFNRKNILDGGNLTEVNQLFIDALIKIGIIEATAEYGQSPGLLRDIPDEIKRIFRTAHEISWQYHLDHQLSFQKYTDNAVSKTINLPQNSTLQDVSDIYRTAWKKGAKGITIYRDQSRQKQVLYAEESKDFPAVSHEGLGECKVCVI